jgi:hypothetical protein
MRADGRTDGRTGGRAGGQTDKHDEVIGARLHLGDQKPYISTHHV